MCKRVRTRDIVRANIDNNRTRLDPRTLNELRFTDGRYENVRSFDLNKDIII